MSNKNSVSDTNNIDICVIGITFVIIALNQKPYYEEPSF